MKALAPTSQAASRRGSALIFVVLSLLVLLMVAAFAVDYGVLALEANRVQRACDAAALAAAVHMTSLAGSPQAEDYAAAREQAVTTAARNGLTITGSNVFFQSGNTQVRVNGSKQVPLFFGRIGGGTSAGIHRHATAEFGWVRSLGGVLPLGLTENDYALYGPGGPNEGQAFTVTLIRNQSEAFQQGNVVGLSVQIGSNGKSPAHWQNELQGTSKLPPVSKGDDLELNSLNANLGNQSGRLQTGLNSRIASGQREFEVFILNPKGQTNGNSPHPVLDVAKVELVQEVTTTGRGASERASLTLRFLPPSQIDLSGRGAELTTNPAAGFSVRTLRLT
ncbi:MAG: pilus assembly protein TadG-related protein, partial [Verrucomicrobiia bacterium]